MNHRTGVSEFVIIFVFVGAREGSKKARRSIMSLVLSNHIRGEATCVCCTVAPRHLSAIYMHSKRYLYEDKVLYILVCCIRLNVLSDLLFA